MAETKNTTSQDFEDIDFKDVNEGEFKPFSEPVVDNLNRPQQPQVISDGQPLPEPDVRSAPPPKINFNMGNGGNEEGVGGSKNIESNVHDDSNLGREDRFKTNSVPPKVEMPDKEKQAGAEATADIIITIYTQVKLQIPKWMSVSDKKLNKLHKDGLLDLRLHIQETPYSAATVTIGEFIQNFNKTLFPPFVTDPRFIEQIRPPLIRLLLKNNAVMTDENQLMFLVIQDLIITGQNAIAIFGQRKDMLDHLKTLTEQSKPIKPSPIQQPTQQPTYTNTVPQTENVPPQKVYVAAKEPEESANSINTENTTTKVTPGIYPFSDKKKRKPGGGRKAKPKNNAIQVIEPESK